MTRFIKAIYDADSKYDLEGLRSHFDKYVENDDLYNFVKYMRCEVRNIGYNLTEEDELCGIEFNIKGPNYKDIDECIKFLKKNISVDGVKIGRQNFKAKGDILF